MGPRAIFPQVIPEGLETRTGLLTLVRLLVPNCPLEFCPQVYNVFAKLIPMLNDTPALAAFQDSGRAAYTTTGDDFETAVKSPICPWLFQPHAYSEPIVEMAKLFSVPAATDVQLTPAGPEVKTGDDTAVKPAVKIPNSP